MLAVTRTVEAIGAARLAADGRIGRMAVRSHWRGQGAGGVGRALLAQCLLLARRAGISCVYLHAQVGAAPFYARYGFVAEGPPFAEAGIPHFSMALDLDSMNWTETRCTPQSRKIPTLI